MARFGTITYALNSDGDIARFLGTVDAIDMIEAKQKLMDEGRGYEFLRSDFDKVEEVESKFNMLQKLN